MGGLQHELKKRQPFASAEQEALLNLMRTADLVQIRFERLFREFGLTPSQYNVLRILRGEGKPLPILEIAERTIAVAPGITGLIDRLEKAGLARRERSTQDRRVIFVCVTAQATELLARIDEPLESLQRDLASPLAQAELRELSRLLEKLRAGCTGKV